MLTLLVAMVLAVQAEAVNGRGVASPPLASSRPAVSTRIDAAPLAALTGPVDEAASKRSALELHDAFLSRANQDDEFGRTLKLGLDVCKQALRLYGPEGVVTSFNGGKDAVAILHLMRAALAQHSDETGVQEGDAAPRLRVIFFEQADEFEEVDAFVRKTASECELELCCYSGGFVDGLTLCIEQYGSKAFVLGTRSADPNAGGQEHFWPSSTWMPPFMRVNPILHFQYEQVWQLLREFDLPFCSLYASGYTSLGKKTDTRRNPDLLRADGTYAPAWELSSGSLERAGREPRNVDAKGATDAKAATAPAAGVDADADADTGAGADAGVDAAASVDAASTMNGDLPALSAEDSLTEISVEGLLDASTAALLVVGDEILCGKVRDGNIYEAAKALQVAGISLKRVSVVGDDLEEIASELRSLSETHDVVITSGGVGPTHDDVTIKAVASALKKPYTLSASMKRLILDKYPDGQIGSDVMRKMSMLPQGTRLRKVPGQEASWPVMQVSNVFVLPGVPQLFASKLHSIVTHFLQCKAPAVFRRVSLSLPEVAIVDALNGVVATQPDARFGSYPVEQGEVQTIITIEADTTEQAEAALTALLAALPTESVERVSDAPALHDN